MLECTNFDREEYVLYYGKHRIPLKLGSHCQIFLRRHSLHIVEKCPTPICFTDADNILEAESHCVIPSADMENIGRWQNRKKESGSVTPA